MRLLSTIATLMAWFDKIKKNQSSKYVQYCKLFYIWFLNCILLEGAFKKIHNSWMTSMKRISHTVCTKSYKKHFETFEVCTRE